MAYSPCLVFYLPPEFSATQQLLNNFAAKRMDYLEKSVDLERLEGSMRTLFYRYIDEVESGATPDPNNYRWNLYRELDIPENSLLAQTSGIGKALPEDTIDFATGLKQVFARFNTDTKFIRAVVSIDERGVFEFLKGGHGFQAPFKLSVKNPIGVYSLVRQQPEGYKIHLTPKPDYAFYTLLRFFTIMKQNKVFWQKNIVAKITLHFRDNLPREDNTELVKLNGGGVPTIVFYGDQDNSTTKVILEVLLSAFKHEVSLLGAMTVDYRYRILPFNIRLNSLISYARGDRLAKLTNRNELAGYTSKTNEEFLYAKKYFIPGWILEMITISNERRANRKVIRDLSTLSLQFLGKDVTSPEVQTMLREPRCMDDICWLTAYPMYMLDPRTITGLELEQASAGSEEADTSGDNAINEDPINPSPAGAGAGSGAPSGGARKKKYRKTKKNPKVKHRRRLSRRGLRN